MTGRELVRRAVLFEGPDRVPRDLPEPWGSDFLHVGADDAPDWKPRVEGEDEWGCVWEKDAEGKTMGQVKVHPLTDYSMLAHFPFPNYDLPARYEQARARIRENAEQKFVLAGIPLSLIHRLEYLRGHVEAWTDPYEFPKELGMLLDRMADIAVDSIGQFAEIGVDGIVSCDDWGLQDRPMVSPAVFREFFKPRYARVYGFARDQGMLTFLHSCGHIAELLDDLIDAGLQVIQMDQQENMGVEELARRFGGRLCFWCPVDIQQTMVKGSLDDIRAYARHLIESFGKFNGGFIAKWYGSPEAVGHSHERIAAMCQSFTEHGSYAAVGGSG
jgi:uroporphyrinogen decarboxylase